MSQKVYTIQYFNYYSYGQLVTQILVSWGWTTAVRKPLKIALTWEYIFFQDQNITRKLN